MMRIHNQSLPFTARFPHLPHENRMYAPLKGVIAPKGQQNIAQGTALGSRTLPPP